MDWDCLIFDRTALEEKKKERLVINIRNQTVTQRLAWLLLEGKKLFNACIKSGHSDDCFIKTCNRPLLKTPWRGSGSFLQQSSHSSQNSVMISIGMQGKRLSLEIRGWNWLVKKNQVWSKESPSSETWPIIFKSSSQLLNPLGIGKDKHWKREKGFPNF